MTYFDRDILALFGLILLVGGVSVTFLKEMIIPIIALFLLLIMVWGDDICSRHDRLNFYGNYFDKGGEIICKDDYGDPLLISLAQGWKHKGQYLFKENSEVEILDDQCEILHQSEPHCISITTQMIIGTIILIGIFGWTFWIFRRMHIHKERKEKIRKGAEES